MCEKIIVTCDENNLEKNEEYTHSIQKAMLITLFETKRINQFQYEYAVELLKKKNRNMK